MWRAHVLAATRSFLRGLCMVIGSLFIVAGVGILAARSPWGQRQILSALLPAVNQGLSGRLVVGGLSGDFIHSLTLHDIALYDSQARAAVWARRAEVRYNPLSLLRRNIHLKAVDLIDGHVDARYLEDGRLNLSALLKPALGRAGRKPLLRSLSVSAFTADLDGQLVPQRTAGTPVTVAQVHVEAVARVADPRITLEIQSLSFRASQPLGAEVEARGVVGIDLSGESPSGHVELQRLAANTSTGPFDFYGLRR